jgi:hypothetical protein
MNARTHLARCATILAAAVLVFLLAGADQSDPPTTWERLGPVRQAKVLAAGAALVILGLAMMALAWLGARATRRYMNRTSRLSDELPRRTKLSEKDWTQKPL